MPAFPFHQAPSVHATDAYVAARTGERAAVLPHDRVHTAPCGLELPCAFAARFEMRRHASPHGAAHCPLEASVLREWCVRRRTGACPYAADGDADAI